LASNGIAASRAVTPGRKYCASHSTLPVHRFHDVSSLELPGNAEHTRLPFFPVDHDARCARDHSAASRNNLQVDISGALPRATRVQGPSDWLGAIGHRELAGWAWRRHGSARLISLARSELEQTVGHSLMRAARYQPLRQHAPPAPCQSLAVYKRLATGECIPLLIYPWFCMPAEACSLIDSNAFR
jgi:hypothetical protein